MLKLRAIEPEPPKQEEVEPVEEVYPPNPKAAQAAASQKKDPNPPAPYRYCMPTHAVYTPPKPTARNETLIFFLFYTKKPTFNFLENEIFYFCFLNNFIFGLTLSSILCYPNNASHVDRQLFLLEICL